MIVLWIDSLATDIEYQEDYDNIVKNLLKKEIKGFKPEEDTVLYFDHRNGGSVSDKPVAMYTTQESQFKREEEVKNFNLSYIKRKDFNDLLNASNVDIVFSYTTDGWYLLRLLSKKPVLGRNFEIREDRKLLQKATELANQSRRRINV